MTSPLGNKIITSPCFLIYTSSACHSEFLWQSDGLASPVLKQFCCFHCYPPSLVYIFSIYHRLTRTLSSVDLTEEKLSCPLGKFLFGHKRCHYPTICLWFAKLSFLTLYPASPLGLHVIILCNLLILHIIYCSRQPIANLKITRAASRS